MKGDEFYKFIEDITNVFWDNNVNGDDITITIESNEIREYYEMFIHEKSNPNGIKVTGCDDMDFDMFSVGMYWKFKSKEV